MMMTTVVLKVDLQMFFARTSHFKPILWLAGTCVFPHIEILPGQQVSVTSNSFLTSDGKLSGKPILRQLTSSKGPKHTFRIFSPINFNV